MENLEKFENLRQIGEPREIESLEKLKLRTVRN